MIVFSLKEILNKMRLQWEKNFIDMYFIQYEGILKLTLNIFLRKLSYVYETFAIFNIFNIYSLIFLTKTLLFIN